MQLSETRIEEKFFLHPNRVESLNKVLLAQGWTISREQPLDTLYVCRDTGNVVEWDPSIRIRARQKIGGGLFTKTEGEFMQKDMLTGEKKIVTAPLAYLQELQEHPEIDKLIGPFLENAKLAPTQFSLCSDRTHFVPSSCVNEKGKIHSFYPRITIDDNYTLQLYEQGKLANSLPFNWAKVEAKTLAEQDIMPLRQILTSVAARPIQTGFIADQIAMIFADNNIQIQLA